MRWRAAHARRLSTSLAVGLIAATSLGGCGGSEGDATPAQGWGEVGLSEAQYVKRATAVCRAHRREIAAELAEADPIGAARAVEEIVLPGFRRQYEGLRRLWPPRGEEDFVDLMLSKFSRSIEDGEEEPTRFFRVKPSGYSEFGEGTLMTEELGIGGCGSQGRSPEDVYEAL